MDTADAVVALIGVLIIALIALALLVVYLWCALRATRLRLVSASRPRSPQQPYETGLKEIGKVR